MSLVSIAQFLPPEVLETILKDALQGTILDERALTTLALSHVCVLFRRVALQCPELWTSLSRKQRRPGLALIEACIERSKGRPLDVALYLYPTPPFGPGNPETMGVDNMIKVVLPFSPRWRSCSIHLVGEEPRDQDITLYSDPLVFSSNVDAPMLEEFSIIEHSSLRGRFSPGSWGRRSLVAVNPLYVWKLPSLYTISTQLSAQDVQMLSIPARIQAHLTDLAVSMTDVQIDSPQGLAKTNSLTTLRLSFEGCRFAPLLHSRFVDAKFPSVKSLHMELLRCAHTSQRPADLWAAFRKQEFPSVVELSLTFDIGYDDRVPVQWRGYNMSLHRLIATDFQLRQNYRFPSLESLNVTILPRGSPRFLITNGKAPTILLPHCCVPSVKHLHIRSSFELSISGDISDVEDEPNASHYMPGDDKVPIALETVTFDLPRVDGVVPWVQQLASKMQETDCWDRFSELNVVQDDGVEVVPRDEVERWCDIHTTIIIAPNSRVI